MSFDIRTTMISAIPSPALRPLPLHIVHIGTAQRPPSIIPYIVHTSTGTSAASSYGRQYIRTYGR
ncbi:hypothetical protein [Jeotgalicoccus halotolerans]|uniref:hypothetical protein n=1 Tax=Jeotgalicoccus halotolerans TaxID=157227 RepID=UPI0011C0370E